MKNKKPRSGRRIENKSAENKESASPPAKPLGLNVTQVRALLILILAIATFLRVYRIDSVPHGFYQDEAADGNSAMEAIETGHFQVFYPENHGREGLFVNLSAACVYFFGNTTWAVRLPTVLFGILNVWMVYLLSTAFFPPPVALLAAFFTATSLWQVMASRFSNRANAAPFFLGLTLYLMVISVERMRQGKPYIKSMLLSGAVYGAGFHTYTAYRASPLLVGGVLLYWYFQARKEGWVDAFRKAALCFAATAVVVVFPLALYLFQHPSILTERAAMVSVFNTAHPLQELILNVWRMAQMFFFAGDANWRHNLSGRRELFWPVAILFAVGIAMAIQAIRPAAKSGEGPRFAYLLMFGWIAVGVLPTILTNDGVPHSIRSSLIVPPVFMLTAAGAWRVCTYLSGIGPRALRVAAAAVFVVALCYEPYHTYFDVWADNPNALVEFSAPLVDLAARVNAVPREVPKYVVLARYSDQVNGTPTEIGTVVFLTKSYTKNQQEAANIHYVTAPRGKVDARALCSQVIQQNAGARVFCLQ